MSSSELKAPRHRFVVIVDVADNRNVKSGGERVAPAATVEGQEHPTRQLAWQPSNSAAVLQVRNHSPPCIFFWSADATLRNTVS